MQKEENFYLRTFGGKHNETGRADYYGTEKKKEKVLTTNTLFLILGNYKFTLGQFETIFFIFSSAILRETLQT